MLGKDLLDRLHLAQAAQQAGDLIAVCLEHALPAVVLIARHVIVGMVAGDDHHRLKDHPAVTALLHRGEHIVQGWLGLHGADVKVLAALVLQHLLHLCIDRVGIRLGPVAHEADRRLAVVVFLCRLDEDVRHAGEVLVACQKRLAHDDFVKGVGIGCELVHQIGVLKAVHQVRRLYDQRLHPVRDRAVQGLGDVVDDLAVARLDMVNDDLAGKAAAHAPVREGLLQRALDPADRQAAAVIEARAEGHDQQLVFTNVILIARVVQRGIAGLVVFFFLFFLRILRILRRFLCQRLRSAAAGQQGDQQKE